MEKLGSRDGGENEQKAMTEPEPELLLFFEIGIHPELLIPTMTYLYLYKSINPFVKKDID